MVSSLPLFTHPTAAAVYEDPPAFTALPPRVSLLSTYRCIPMYMRVCKVVEGAVHFWSIAAELPRSRRFNCTTTLPLHFVDHLLQETPRETPPSSTDSLKPRTFSTFFFGVLYFFWAPTLIYCQKLLTYYLRRHSTQVPTSSRGM